MKLKFVELALAPFKIPLDHKGVPPPTLERHNYVLTAQVTYWDFTVCHQDGEVGEMTAGAGAVSFIGLQEFAALGGPVTHHAPLRVIPEGAVGVEVVLHLQITRDMVECPNNWLPETEAHVEHGGRLPPTQPDWRGWGCFTPRLSPSFSYVVSNLAHACEINQSIVRYTRP